MKILSPNTPGAVSTVAGEWKGDWSSCPERVSGISGGGGQGEVRKDSSLGMFLHISGRTVTNYLCSG